VGMVKVQAYKRKKKGGSRKRVVVREHERKR